MDIKELTILIDSREQLPLSFRGISTLRAGLKTGDYSCTANGIDLRDVVAIERKSIGDLLGCIGGQRDRFERELERLAKLRYRALVIEGSIVDLVDATAGRRLTPRQVLGSVLAWIWKFNCPPIFSDNRTAAAVVVATLLRHAARYALADRTGPGIAGAAMEPEERGLS
ncbi:ERCC4 domain-containing protein [Candidatus Binatus sp.]|uniref:ERCC4 domain-containing protein n=1 Tax=Candidatus Binatus sp. TaxID=2811406 RepID=UPI003CC677CC